MRSTKVQHQDYDSLISISHLRWSIEFLPNSIWVKRDVPCLWKNQLHPGARGKKSLKTTTVIMLKGACQRSESDWDREEFWVFFLIKKCNQSMFNPTWQRGRWRWMLLLGGAPVVWGVQGHSPSWARLLHSLCPVAASTWQWKLQQQFNSIERSIQGLTLKQTHAKWAPQMCTTISKRTDLRVHASHYKHR